MLNLCSKNSIISSNVLSKFSDLSGDIAKSNLEDVKNYIKQLDIRLTKNIQNIYLFQIYLYQILLILIYLFLIYLPYYFSYIKLNKLSYSIYDN